MRSGYAQFFTPTAFGPPVLLLVWLASASKRSVTLDTYAQTAIFVGSNTATTEPGFYGSFTQATSALHAPGHDRANWHPTCTQHSGRHTMSSQLLMIEDDTRLAQMG